MMTVAMASRIIPAKPHRIYKEIRQGLIPTVPVYGDTLRHHIDADALARSLEGRGFAAEAARVRAWIAEQRAGGAR